MTPSAALKARPQGAGSLGQMQLILFPESEMHGVFSNKDLPSTLAVKSALFWESFVSP